VVLLFVLQWSDNLLTRFGRDAGRCFDGIFLSQPRFLLFGISLLFMN